MSCRARQVMVAQASVKLPLPYIILLAGSSQVLKYGIGPDKKHILPRYTTLYQKEKKHS